MLKDRRVVSVDWDWRSVRIVQASVRGDQVRVLAAVQRALDPGLAYGDPAGLGRFIRRVMDEERIAAGAAIVDIPRDQTVLHSLLLPKAKLDDLAGMVRLQISKELPFALEESVVDFVVAGEEENGQQRVVVAAVRNEVLESFREVFSQAKLKLARVGLRPYANVMAVERALSGAGDGRTMFVDVGPTLTEIDIIRDGRLLFSRSAAVAAIPVPAARREESEPAEGVDAAAPLTEEQQKEKIVRTLVVELVRTLEAFRATEPNAAPDRVVIGGSCGIEAMLAEAAGPRLRAPVQLYAPPASLVQRLRTPPPMIAFSAALGLVLGHTRGTEQVFDFLHPKEPQAEQRERARRIPLIAATIILALVACGAFFWNLKVRPQKQRLAVLTAQIADLEDEYKATKKFRELVEQIDGTWQAAPIWVDDLVLLAEAAPETKEAYLNNLALTDRGTISVKFVTKNNQTPNTLADALSKVERPVAGGRTAPRYDVRLGTTRRGKDEAYPYSAELTAELLREQEKKTPGR